MKMALVMGIVFLAGFGFGAQFGHPRGKRWCDAASIERLENVAQECSEKLAACDPTAPTPWPRYEVK